MWVTLETYHDKRKDQADEEEAEPVHWPSNNVRCGTCCLCEQFSGQNVSHAAFTEEEITNHCWL